MAARWSVCWSFVALAVLYIISPPLLNANGLRISHKTLDTVAERYGAPARGRVLAWQDLILENRHLDDRAKLRKVNAFFNRIKFVDDIVHWEAQDYWATPLEFLSTSGGDCEDFSIAKYFTLREMGVEVERMKITYVKAVELNQAHMVLAYYSTPGAEPLVLDNLIDEIRPGSERTDLVPVYSFNGDGLWLSANRGQGKRVGDSRRIKHWRNLALRMEREHGQVEGDAP